MPWSAKTFRERHNKGLTAGQAKKAARQANAILRSGASERVAIATANKHAHDKPKESKKARSARWYG